jgi:hypothetical protein
LGKPNRGNPNSKGRKPKIEIDHSGRWTLLLNDPWGHLFGRGMLQSQCPLEYLDAANEDRWGRLPLYPDFGKPPLTAIAGGGETAKTSDAKEAA